MKKSNRGDGDWESAGDIDRLIHEPSRYLLMSYLYVVDAADFLFLINQTGMTWGNLSAHLSKLEAAGYVVIAKEFIGKKPHSTVMLSNKGRQAFNDYRSSMKQVLENLPESRSPKD